MDPSISISRARNDTTRAFWQRLRRSDLPTAILFILPSVVILAVFSFYPIGAAVRLSLFKWDNLAPLQTYIGLTNYLTLFHNARFWSSLGVTFEYTAGVTVLSMVLGLVLAVALNQRWLVFKSLWRSLFFLPVVTPTVAAAMVWMLIFNPGFGLINVFLRSLSLPGPNWLADLHWALPTVMSLGIWRRVGFNLIIYLAALQGIPADYYESAQVDGASGWQTFRNITIPLLKSTTVMLTILGMIDSFLVFDPVMVLTRGGPADVTNVIGMYLYTTAFGQFKMGLGAALSLVMFLVIALFTLLQWRFVGLGTAEETA